MRTFRLAQVAATAEALRLRRLARRMAVRAVMGVVAAVFGVAFLVALHVAGGMALAREVGPVYAVLIVGGVDLVIAIIFGVLASSSAPDKVEREAYQVRETARAQLMETVALTSLIGPLARLVGGKKLYGLVLAALTARYLGGRR